MMSLFLSSISCTTTGAMTLMPFILIFQLVFSGGIIPLPEWSRPISNFTISNYGIRALASQSGYNELPMNTVWNTLSGMKDTQIGGSVTIGEIIDKLDSPVVERNRDREILKSYSAADLAAEKLNRPVTVGDVVDLLKDNKALQNHRDKTITLKATVGELMDIVGEENVKEFVMRKTAEAARKPEYEKTRSNVFRNWAFLGIFILVFAMLATIVLEMIDKDKR